MPRINMPFLSSISSDDASSLLTWTWKVSKEPAIKSAVALLYSSTLILSWWQLHEDIEQSHQSISYKNTLEVITFLLTLTILAPGYYLYGEHVFAFFYEEENNLQQLKHHIDSILDNNKIAIQNSSKDKIENPLIKGLLDDDISDLTDDNSLSAKPMLATAAVILTLPLGWTKSSALSNNFVLRALWLLGYSFMDAIPHINHVHFLQPANAINHFHFQQGHAIKLFAVLMMMLTHAAEDAIDFINVNQANHNDNPIPQTVMLTWLGFALISELGLAYVESTVHSEEHSESSGTRCSYLDTWQKIAIWLGQITTWLYIVNDTFEISSANGNIKHDPIKWSLSVATGVSLWFSGREAIHHLNSEQAVEEREYDRVDSPTPNV